MPRLIYVVLSIITVAFMFSACAQDGKDGRNGIDLTAKEETAMSTRGCVTCHSDYKEVVAASGHMTKNTYLAGNPTCLVCHSPDLGYLDIRTDDTYTGGVSCTGCHALDPKVKDNPIHSSYELTSDKCITCHGAVTGHEKYINPYATNIAADFGKIEDSYPGHSFASKKAIRDGDPRACGVCHSSKVFSNIVNKVSPRIVTAVSVGGTTKYRTAGGPNEKMYANFPAYSASAKALHLDRAGSDAVGCDGCHQPHSTELLAEDVISTGTTVVASAEFLLCTSCHLANVEIESNGRNTVLSPLYTGAVDANGILTDKDADASLLEHHGLNFEGNPTHTILDTHFKGELYSKYSINEGKVKVDNATKISVAGYNIRAGYKNACTSCHNVHASSVFEPKKDDKAYKALAESWSKTMHGTQTRGSNCVPCHSAGREYAKVLMGSAKPTSNRDVTDPNKQISCLTCHMGDYERSDNATIITGSNAKKLRFAKTAAEFNRINGPTDSLNTTTNVVTSGIRILQEITQAEYDAIKAQYPADSVMLCGGCHVGSRYGTVKSGFVDATGTSAISVGRGHWKQSFGMFTGLIFDLETNRPAGKTYTTGPRGAHVAQTVKTGCLSCHIGNSEDHSFEVLNEAKTNLLTTNTDCLNCHGNGILDLTGVNYRGQVESVKKALWNMITTTASSGSVAQVTIAKHADADVRKKLGMALGNILTITAANSAGTEFRADQGLFAHTTKRFLQELIYDNLFVLSANGYTGVTFNGGVIDFTNAKVMSTTAGDLDPADKAALTAFFAGFVR